MGESKDRERPRENTAAPKSPPGASKPVANAVQTPPPDTSAGYDPEAATLIDASAGFDAPATVIDLPTPHDAPTMLDARPLTRPQTPVSRATQPPQTSWNAPLMLPIGTVLGNRYEILQLLGEGGMGAVYKARDTELDRVIALKVIRPELASNPEILQRFKQELVLARQVTDRNIIRIFDLGEADGIRFITMEYVEGTSLYQILREQGKLTVKDAAEIIEQVLTGLKAAHREGVIHRDLKPGNIMRDPHGRILVMDFGLARSLQSDGMTKTGAVLGTMEYMSPEQAMGSELDPRSDLFTVGLIFFELLTGKMPFKAETALASLLKRVQERAVALSSLDNTIPIAVERMVAKCLERDVNQRYQTAQEMIDDLHKFLGHGPTHGAATTLHFPPVHSWGRNMPWKWGSAAAVVAVLVIAGVMLRGKFTSGPTAANKSVSVLVADFTNHTGDPIFDDTLEPMFNVALEGASFINAYSRGTARNLAKQLPHPSDKLDEESARLIGVSQGLAAVVTGSVTLRGDAYKLSVEALDARTGNSIATADITARNKDELLVDIPKLAAPIRKALGDTTPVSAQLAVSGPFTAASLEVVHLYSLAMQEQFAGKTPEAFQNFSKAIELDPSFARAYAGMSGTANDLGRQADGEKYIKLAMEHLDRMTERERYHTRGFYYLIAGNYLKCVEEYSTLVGQYPADRVGQSDLAWCYAYLRNFPKAVEAARKAKDIAPKGALEHLNLAFFSSFAGDFQTGEREARTALEISPSEVAQINLAEAQLGQDKLREASESFHGLEKFGSRGASLEASALADLAMYQGRLSEDAQLLEKGAEADLKAKSPENATNKFAALAYAQLLRGQKAAAISAAEKALGNGQTLQVRFLAGRVFAEAGETAQAKKMADSLAKETQAEPQAYGKIIEGKIALKQGDRNLAIKNITDANNLLDTWIGRFELGRAYLEAGQFTEADSEFDRCLKRRGEALELLMDNVVTYGYVPYVYYYQGRVRQGLETPAFAESYRTFLNTRGQSTEDPLVSEVRKSLGQ
jgi:eukaryotic-like serine/threonine-protein kinase